MSNLDNLDKEATTQPDALEPPAPNTVSHLEPEGLSPEAPKPEQFSVTTDDPVDPEEMRERQEDLDRSK